MGIGQSRSASRRSAFNPFRKRHVFGAAASAVLDLAAGRHGWMSVISNNNLNRSKALVLSTDYCAKPGNSPVRAYVRRDPIAPKLLEIRRVASQALFCPAGFVGFWGQRRRTPHRLVGRLSDAQRNTLENRPFSQLITDKTILYRVVAPGAGLKPAGRFLKRPAVSCSWTRFAWPSPGDLPGAIQEDGGWVFGQVKPHHQDEFVGVWEASWIQSRRRGLVFWMGKIHGAVGVGLQVLAALMARFERIVHEEVIPCRTS